MPATSERQRRFMGMVYAYKRGDKKSASPEVRKAARSMTKEQARDFAKKGRNKRRSRRRSSR